MACYEEKLRPEVRCTYYLSVCAVYSLWLEKARAYFPKNDSRHNLLMTAQNRLNSEYGLAIKQISRVREEAVDVHNDIGNWNEERLNTLLVGWEQLIDWQNWYPKPDPFFVVLPRVYADLPRLIPLGVEPAQSLQRRFDRTYIPRRDMLTDEMIAAVFDYLASLIDQESFVDRQLKNEVMKIIVAKTRITSLPPGSKILDVAVGTGWSADFIDRRKYQIIGIDLSPIMVEYARQKDILAIRADAAVLPFPDGCFPAIICSYGAHWFRDKNPFLEMKRVLAKGGILSFNYHRPGDDWAEFGEEMSKIFGTDNLEILPVEIKTDRGVYSETIITYRKKE